MSGFTKHMDSSAHTTLVDLEIVNKIESLLTQKSSTKTVSLSIQKSAATMESFLALLFFLMLGVYILPS